MIVGKYIKPHIILTPDNMDENQKLMDCIKDIPGVAYKNGNWYISENYVNTLNEKTKPLAKLFKIEDSFKKFVKDRGLVKKASNIRIFCGVVESKILGKGVPHKDIEDACKYFWKPAVRNPKFKAKKWDGYIKLYRRWDRTFPTGLLYRVLKVLDNKKIKYDVHYSYDQNPKRQFDWYVDDGIVPDPDQIEAIEAAFKGKRGVLKAPTGFGKTAILAKRLTAKFGVPTLFVANKKSLLDDAAEEFLDGIVNLNQVGEIKDGQFDTFKIKSNTQTEDIPDITSPVLVGTIQSLHARLMDDRTRYKLKYWLNNICKFIMVDECQAVGTMMWDEVLNECFAPIRIMLSATPKRTDGAKLKINAQSGPPLFSTTAEEQIDKGRLCELDIEYRVYDHKLYNEKDEGIQYQDGYRAWIVENEERNREMIIKPTLEMLDEGRFPLVLIGFIDHGFILKEMFINAGIPEKDIRFVYGNSPDEARKNAIKEFRKGKFRILIGSTIFDAGVNIPIISGVVLAGAGNSEITHIQRIGRGARNADYEKSIGYLPEFMRVNHGQKITKVIDVFDANVKFFTNQSWNRYKITKDEFGASRVKIVGDINKVIKKKKSKSAKKNIKQIEAHKAQLEILKKFQETGQMPDSSSKGNFDPKLQNLIDIFNDHS